MGPQSRHALSLILTLAWTWCCFGQSFDDTPMTVLAPPANHQASKPVIETRHWKWTPDAAHHQAVVQVRTAGGSGGSGVHFGDGWILTAAHVTEGSRSGVVIFPNGNQYPYRLAGQNYRGDIDISYMKTDCSKEPSARIAQSPPAHGEVIELVGYGGPGPNAADRDKQRHFAMTIDAAS